MPVLVCFCDRTSHTTADPVITVDLEEWTETIGSAGTSGWRLMHNLTANATVGWDQQNEILAEFDNGSIYCWDSVAKKWGTWILENYNRYNSNN